MRQYASIDLRDYVQHGPRRHGDGAAGPPPADPDPRASSASTRYPSGVELCRTPRQYSHVLQRSGGEICARLPGPPPAVLRWEDGEWYCYEPRAGRAPLVERLDRDAVLSRLRTDRPIMVTDREEADLLATGACNRRESPGIDPVGPPERRRATSTGRTAGGSR